MGTFSASNVAATPRCWRARKLQTPSTGSSPAWLAPYSPLLKVEVVDSAWWATHFKEETASQSRWFQQSRTANAALRNWPDGEVSRHQQQSCHPLPCPARLRTLITWAWKREKTHSANSDKHILCIKCKLKTISHSPMGGTRRKRWAKGRRKCYMTLPGFMQGVGAWNRPPSQWWFATDVGQDGCGRGEE